MSQIAYPPVQKAMRKLKVLSSDDETRRLAEVRERALSTERTEINAALKRGKEIGTELGKEIGKEIGKKEGESEANAKAISSLLQNGIAATEAEARKFLGLAQLPIQV